MYYKIAFLKKFKIRTKNLLTFLHIADILISQR